MKKCYVEFEKRGDSIFVSFFLRRAEKKVEISLEAMDVSKFPLRIDITDLIDIELEESIKKI